MGIFILVFLVSLISVRCICYLCNQFNVLDNPNYRSSHSQPTALMGGLGFLLTIFITILVIYPNIILQYPLVAVSLLVLIVTSCVDDLYDISSLYRLFVHIGVGVCFYASGFQLSVIWLPFGKIALLDLAPIITVIYSVFWINVYNFMDGMDGYAGSMTVIGLIGVSSYLALNGNVEYLKLLLIMVSAIAGFLVLNLPKAKIFMGDVGSATLGAIVALITIRLNQGNSVDTILPIWKSLIIFSVFWMDASVILMRRVINGEKFWRPHREHFYQRLLRSGWSHKKTLILEVSHMCFMGTLVIINAPVWIVMVCFLISFLMKYLMIEKIFLQMTNDT